MKLIVGLVPLVLLCLPSVESVLSHCRRSILSISAYGDPLLFALATHALSSTSPRPYVFLCLPPIPSATATPISTSTSTRHATIRTLRCHHTPTTAAPLSESTSRLETADHCMYTPLGHVANAGHCNGLSEVSPVNHRAGPLLSRSLGRAVNHVLPVNIFLHCGECETSHIAALFPTSHTCSPSPSSSCAETLPAPSSRRAPRSPAL